VCSTTSSKGHFQFLGDCPSFAWIVECLQTMRILYSTHIFAIYKKKGRNKSPSKLYYTLWHKSSGLHITDISYIHTCEVRVNLKVLRTVWYSCDFLGCCQRRRDITIWHSISQTVGWSICAISECKVHISNTGKTARCDVITSAIDWHIWGLYDL